MEEGDGRKAGLMVRVENVVRCLLIIQKRGEIIVEGLSTSSRVGLYKGRSGWRALCPRSKGLGSARPPNNACLRERASGRRQRRLSASAAGSGRVPRAPENPGLEEDAEL